MRALDAEAPQVFRTASGRELPRLGDSRSLSPWLRLSAVETGSGRGVLFEAPREALTADVLARDRASRGSPRSIVASDAGALALATELAPSRSAYRESAREAPATYYALFRWVDGVPLSRALAAARAGQCFSPSVVATLAVELAGALAEATGPGLLTPERVVLSTNGRAILRGAVLEHLADALEATTVARPRLAYLAPELVRGGAPRPMDSRGRSFALGLMLTELLTGRAVLPQDPRAARLLADWSLKVPELPVDAPAELRAVLWGLLQRDPDRRPQPAMLLELLAPLYEPGAHVATALLVTSDGRCPFL